MRELTLLSPRQAVEEASRFKVSSDVDGTSSDPIVSSMELRRIDQFLPQAKRELGMAMDSGELPTGILSSGRVDPWTRKPVEIKIAAIRAGGGQDADRGYVFVAQKRPGEDPELWACDEANHWIPERSIDILIPEALAMIAELSRGEGIAKLLSSACREEIESGLASGAISKPPRM